MVFTQCLKHNIYINTKLVFHLKHVWMDITDLNAFICAPTLILVDGVWRGNVSVQKKAVTQEPDVEVVRNVVTWTVFFSFFDCGVYNQFYFSLKRKYERAQYAGHIFAKNSIKKIIWDFLIEFLPYKQHEFILNLSGQFREWLKNIC